HVPASGAHTPTMPGLSAAWSDAGCELAASATSTRALTGCGSGACEGDAAACMIENDGSIMVRASTGNPAPSVDWANRDVTASAACWATDDGACACSVAAESDAAIETGSVVRTGDAAGTGAAAETGAMAGTGSLAGTGAAAGTGTDASLNAGPSIFGG